MLTLSDMTYSVMRALRTFGFDISDEESQGANEKTILLTTDGISATSISFNQGEEKWKVSYTFIGRGSSKDQVLALLNDFLIATARGLYVPMSTTGGAFSATEHGKLISQAGVLLSLPYSWTFSQQFNLEVYEEV